MIWRTLSSRRPDQPGVFAWAQASFSSDGGSCENVSSAYHCGRLSLLKQLRIAMLPSILLDDNARRVICNSQEIRSQGLGKDQKVGFATL